MSTWAYRDIDKAFGYKRVCWINTNRIQLLLNHCRYWKDSLYSHCKHQWLSTWSCKMWKRVTWTARMLLHPGTLNLSKRSFGIPNTVKTLILILPVVLKNREAALCHVLAFDSRNSETTDDDGDEMKLTGGRGRNLSYKGYSSSIQNHSDVAYICILVFRVIALTERWRSRMMSSYLVRHLFQMTAGDRLPTREFG